MPFQNVGMRSGQRTPTNMIKSQMLICGIVGLQASIHLQKNTTWNAMQHCVGHNCLRCWCRLGPGGYSSYPKWKQRNASCDAVKARQQATENIKDLSRAQPTKRDARTTRRPSVATLAETKMCGFRISVDSKSAMKLDAGC